MQTGKRVNSDTEAFQCLKELDFTKETIEEIFKPLSVKTALQKSNINYEQKRKFWLKWVIIVVLSMTIFEMHVTPVGILFSHKAV